MTIDTLEEAPVQADEVLVLSPDMAGTLMTPEEFDASEVDPDDGSRYELIQGMLIVTPIPFEADADPKEELGHLLRNYQESHPKGRVLDKTLAERHVFSGRNRRRPDRVIWAGLGRLPKPRLDPPTIVVEFVSAGRRNRDRDYIEKRREYKALGMQEYWVIDRFRRTMTVYGAKVSAAGKIISEKGAYSTPLLPGFKLPLARLFAMADAWK
jgi:Uma2 family endonuclease